MLKVDNISFSYSDNTTISNISFSVQKGNTIAVIGESGCGKSTLLKCIYGLYDLHQGTIFWNDKQVLGPKYNLIPGMEFMKYLAQDFDLMPYVSVEENVGKYLSNIYKDKKQQRIYELLETVEMTEYAKVKAQFLSGGQMQRVALAKALALEPQVLLLDEPFSHIDNFRKNNLRRKIFTFLKQKNITTIIATHDCNDVLSFCNEVLVLKKGVIIEQGTPKDIYNTSNSGYTTSLFDDVNQLFIDGKELLLYPHQLQKVEHSNVVVTVTENFYRGNNYLIEAILNNKKVYFNHNTQLKIGEKVYLKITNNNH